MNKYGDIGFPCRIPLDGLKYSVFVPFISIAIRLVDTHDMISLIMLLGKLKKWRVSFMKDHSYQKPFLGQFLRLDLPSFLSSF